MDLRACVHSRGHICRLGLQARGSICNIVSVVNRVVLCCCNCGRAMEVATISTWRVCANSFFLLAFFILLIEIICK